MATESSPTAESTPASREMERSDATSWDEPATIECVDPATGDALGHVRVMDPEQVRDAVERARAAQPAWAETSFAERRAVMRDLMDVIIDRQADICELCARDSGKTRVDAALGEVFPVCEKIRYLIDHGAGDLRPQKRRSGFLAHKAARVVYDPLGVVGVIAPWNFPFHNIYCPLVPALFAGNGVVVKVSEHVSWSADALVAIVRDVLEARGHSPELVQLVTGFGKTGEALVRGGVEKIFFTGSPQNGRKVMAAASDSLTPVVLELGGMDPMIVCDDANLDHAVDQAMLGVYTASGQMCVAVERIYAHTDIYDAFIERAVAKVENLRQGAPLEHPGDVDMGAMTMPRQLDIIQSLVDDAVEKGARVLIGGEPDTDRQGNYYKPTIIVDVDHTMRITQEEHFGPVMVVMEVDSDEEAIALTNDCPYGLGSSVFTRDRARAERIAGQIKAGMTVVNDYGIAYMIQSLPFGGTKISGLGRINGREGLRACCNTKAIVTDRLPLGAGVSVYPITPKTFGLVEGAIGALYGKGLVQRGKSAVKALRSLVEVVKARRGRD